MSELASSRLKLGRARDHLMALDRRVKRFVKSDAYSLYSEYDPHTTEQILRLRIVKWPKLDAWSLLIGDVVHTLRSALDHIVWDLTIRHRGTRPAYPLDNDWRGLEFPIFRDKPVYLYGGQRRPTKNRFPRGGGLYKIRGVDPRLHTLFESLQPFHDGPKRDRNLLQVLHELDLIDKHRNIPVLASTVIPEGINVVIRPLPLLGQQALSFQIVKLYPPGPFKDGTPLARVRQSGKWRATTYWLPKNTEAELSFSVHLAKGRPTMGLPVLPALAGMIARVEEVIEMLEVVP
jgi:hypothetical protein